MALSKEQYTAFEDIVGPEYINDDPVILDSYSWRSGLLAGVDKFSPRFEAVLLPDSTKEVQAIVRLCNKLNLQYKASSTGWGAYNDASGPGVIRLDLRRMDRILEINEKNMYAVVEPYVVGAQLQAECMKRGFICNQCGAGANCSALPIAAHQGVGHLSQSASYGERNQLALEWVTPEGEIVRFGSLGSLDEWFCGDGPGPSLRGIVRGNVVPLGGLGVYTKAATKLYHWAGPEVYPVEGVSPHYGPKQPPENFSIGFYSFPDLELLKQAVQKIGETEISFELMGFNAAMAAANLATSNEEDISLFREFREMVKGPCFMIIIAGNSKNDFEYKTKVLKMIVDQYQGEELEKLTEDPKVAGACIWRWTRSTGSIRETFRASGAFGGEVGGTDNFPLMADYIQITAEAKKSLIEKGLIYNDDTVPFTQSFEHGHYGHGELLIRYRPNPETLQAMMEDFMSVANDTAINGHYGVPAHVFGDHFHDLYGPHASNYDHWLRQIKRTFDPKNTSDSTHYITDKQG
ncbi:MAG: FAD-binding oxidoreductase [Dehalococcoidales bacterium]|nr:FAD-binding oxidoreductase [Dehalococcoidales bacterium]